MPSSSSLLRASQVIALMGLCVVTSACQKDILSGVQKCDRDRDCPDGYHCVNDACEEVSGGCVGSECPLDCASLPTIVHGDCLNGTITCDEGFVGTTCTECADSNRTYPNCGDLCEPNPCNGRGTCTELAGTATCDCDDLFSGDTCDTCTHGGTYPDDCDECAAHEDCDASEPVCFSGRCVECLPEQTPPEDVVCQGVCGAMPPVCDSTTYAWTCDGPGFEPEEESCDGFDNDCDGVVDEGVCAPCTPVVDAIQANLQNIRDIDFDWECNTYLTTIKTGADYTRVIYADPTVVEPDTYYGNANQNMGYALVDPDPNARRVIVTYSCCEGCSCWASNGVTLLYTCDGSDTDCGCYGNTNCPGFLDAPFLDAPYEDTDTIFNLTTVTTPSGLAAGPGNTYYVANYNPKTCSAAADCTACTPENPDTFCIPDGNNCCEPSAIGRLAQFTLPDGSTPPSWRVVSVEDGDEILGLASGRDGTVMYGTASGKFYRLNPFTQRLDLLNTYGASVMSITQARASGDWYVEIKSGDPKIFRLAEDGTELTLPESIATSPGGEGVLQVSPDNKLYRLLGRVDSLATLTVYDIP